MANTKTNRRQKAKLKGSVVETEGDVQGHPAITEESYDSSRIRKPNLSDIVVKPSNKGRVQNADTSTITPFRPALLAARAITNLEPTVTSVILERYPSIDMSSARIFIASLGNPSPYQATRHSAGHVLLKALQAHLKFPPLKKSKPYANGLVSMGADVGRPEYMLWQSPSYMNVSGKDLLKAYRQFAKETCGSATGNEVDFPGLVVLHDEMETAPGQLKARSGSMSAKGHNGIKSVQQSLKSAGLMDRLTEPGPGGKFIKIGIGIGRPAGGSRDKEEVSAYVLGKFGVMELEKLAGSAAQLEKLIEEARLDMDPGV